MNSFNTTAISAAGMTVQQQRLEAAALNLANMNSSIAPGTAGYRPVAAVIRLVPSFASMFAAGDQRLLLPKAELMTQTGNATREVYEPGHPDADEAGKVHYPAVDHTREMLTVMSALRSYEANLTAWQASRAMAAKALDIGS